MHRRKFLGAMGAATFGVTSLATNSAMAQTSAPTSAMNFSGPDLSGWETVVGDGIYAPPGIAAVTKADIATINARTHSSLVANVNERPVMAHNIAFNRLIGDNLFDFKHDCAYEFRLPNLATASSFRVLGTKAQTVEGGLFVWDGGDTRRDYGFGFQWVLNPWDRQYGEIQTWSMSNSRWRAQSYLEPDNEWHRIEASLDHQRNWARLAIDGVEIKTPYTHHLKPDSWGTETAARLQVEAISLFPGSAPSAPVHTVDVRNWSWDCTPA